MNCKTIENLTLGEERALYGTQNTTVKNCTFAGEAQGESALKECRGVKVENCKFLLKYPLWNGKKLVVVNSFMDVTARAAVWYSDDSEFTGCELNGIKVFRECNRLKVTDCKISSFEAGWRCNGVELENCEVLSEYLLSGSKNITIKNCVLDGKYALQYIENAKIENCKIYLRDCLWHAKNVHVKNCTLSGEYLAWYSENLTLENCEIEGTQPLCYCKGLKLINCRMKNCDLSFELSEVDADVRGEITSVRSPLSGKVAADGIGEILNDVPAEYGCSAEIVIRKK